MTSVEKRVIEAAMLFVKENKRRAIVDAECDRHRNDADLRTRLRSVIALADAESSALRAEFSLVEAVDALVFA